MKQSRKQGFTLIELLVVISIIAILAGLLLPTLTSVFKSADKSKARTEMSSIATAVKAYMTEYGRLPADDSDQGRVNSYNDSYAGFTATITEGTTYTGAGSSNVIDRLIGENPRRISFLESPSGSGDFKDPWGVQYGIVLDTDYDSLLSINGDDVRLTVVVFSRGDGQTEWLFSHEE